jgi:hypothetical protein
VDRELPGIRASSQLERFDPVLFSPLLSTSSSMR